MRALLYLAFFVFTSSTYASNEVVRCFEYFLTQEPLNEEVSEDLVLDLEDQNASSRRDGGSRIDEKLFPELEGQELGYCNELSPNQLVQFETLKSYAECPLHWEKCGNFDEFLEVYLNESINRTSAEDLKLIKELSVLMAKDKALHDELKKYQDSLLNDSDALTPKSHKDLRKTSTKQLNSQAESARVEGNADDLSLSDEILSKLKMWWISILEVLDRIIALLSSLFS